MHVIVHGPTLTHADTDAVIVHGPTLTYADTGTVYTTQCYAHGTCTRAVSIAFQ